MTEKQPIACDMSGAPDTPQQRAAAYQRLFETALRERVRSAQLVRFRFHRNALDHSLLQLLVERERACCPFFDMQIRTSGDEVWWETRVDPDPDAEAMLEELYRLPERVAHDPSGTAQSLPHRALVTAPGSPRTGPDADDELDASAPAHDA